MDLRPLADDNRGRYDSRMGDSEHACHRLGKSALTANTAEAAAMDDLSPRVRSLETALPLFNIFAELRNRFVWYLFPWVGDRGSRPSGRPAPELACRYTPGCSSVCHFER